MKRRKFFKSAIQAGALGIILPGTTLKEDGASGDKLHTAAILRPRSANAIDKYIDFDQSFPRGKALRVKPILVFSALPRVEKNSWRFYGAIQTLEDAKEEATRIMTELGQLKKNADFPIEILPLEMLDSQDKLTQVAVNDSDLCLLYASGYCTQWPLNVPMVMFLRQKSGPFYLGFEIAHWKYLRGSGDKFLRQDVSLDDVVVDSYDEMLWRLRSMYGLKNARGTKVLAIGGLKAYSQLAQENGPRVAKDTWGYEFADVTYEEFAKRLESARADQKVVKAAKEQTDELLKMPNVKLETDRKYVFNTYMALYVVRQLLQETGASNYGFATCMENNVIAMLDTPPCLVHSLANDEGYTGYCHTDLSHIMPGVLLRWIASRPTFLCNSHFPYDGKLLFAHCQAPRRMNGHDFEPATIMTHFESDYGAACKTHYTIDQMVTAVIPNLACTKWQGFRGKIIDVPSYAACRSQMEILVDGDFKRLAREMEGFHTQIVYGDYTREVGYALNKLGSSIQWQCYS